MLKNLAIAIKDRIRARQDPVSFARSLGVDVHDSVQFYGISRGMFGSEPWLIRIGAESHITAGVTFVTHDGGTLILRDEEPTLEWTAPIEIDERVYIGIQSIVLPGVRIGKRSIIGAGSIVGNDIPENSVAVGRPAKVICSTDEYKEKMLRKSLGLGHLKGEVKDAELRKFYRDRGWFNGETPQ